MQVTIKVTVCIENALWVGIFERTDDEGLSASRAIFGKEPTDPELYQWLLENYDKLNFSAPQKFQLLVKRKNPKRMLRDVKKEMKKAAENPVKESFAQEVLRLELEKNKKVRNQASREQKEEKVEERFALRQEKKKQKKRGH